MSWMSSSLQTNATRFIARDYRERSNEQPNSCVDFIYLELTLMSILCGY
jgi:hypothetical protein